MNRKTIKCIATSLAVLSCMYTVPQRTMAEIIDSTNLEDSISYTFNKDKCKEEEQEKKKDDCKCKDEEQTNDKKKEIINDSDKAKKEKNKTLNIFTDENCKYLSSNQKKQLAECKECIEKGEKLSEEQKKSLNEMVDCIIKGRLGDKKYKDFTSIIEKKNKGTKLTEDEEKKLEEYKNIIEGKAKTTSADILKQFLR